MPVATSCPMCIFVKYAMLFKAPMAVKALVAKSKRYLEM